MRKIIRDITQLVLIIGASIFPEEFLKIENVRLMENVESWSLASGTSHDLHRENKPDKLKGSIRGSICKSIVGFFGKTS